MSTTTAWSRRQVVASALSMAALAALPIPTTAVKQQPNTKGNPMTQVTAFILFDGNCAEAMAFYKSCFGGELTLTKVKDTPAKDHMPPALHERTVYARLKSGNIEFSATDWLMQNRTRIQGNSVCLYLNTETYDDLKSLFAKLSAGSDVTDPLTETFYGLYGALNDRFGVRWMFQANKPA